MDEKRAVAVDGVDKRERVVLLEGTSTDERADTQESTEKSERADTKESAAKIERAELGESAGEDERAIERESANNQVRAEDVESADNDERAAPKESAEPPEPPIHRLGYPRIGSASHHLWEAQQAGWPDHLPHEAWGALVRFHNQEKAHVARSDDHPAFRPDYAPNYMATPIDPVTEPNPLPGEKGRR